MAVTTFDQIAEKAASVQPLRLLLSIIAAPFYVVGVLIGVVWLLASWAYAAVLVGVSDARARRDVSADGVS